METHCLVLLLRPASMDTAYVRQFAWTAMERERERTCLYSSACWEVRNHKKAQMKKMIELFSLSTDMKEVLRNEFATWQY